MLPVDECLLAGATVQCALVLKGRRFQLHDWIVPLFVLVAGSLGWFGFITLCSTPNDAAGVFVIGFALALTGASVFVSEAAPLRVNATTLLSLTLTFWAASRVDGSRPGWFFAAVVMSALAAAYALGPWKAPALVRFALYAWALVAAASLAAAAIPAQVTAVIGDYRHDELAPLLNGFEVLVAGAQLFLLCQLSVGLLLMAVPAQTETDWLSSRLITSYAAGAGPRWTAILAILAQAAALAWAGRAGGQLKGDVLALSVLAALAHGAMTGDDAAGAAPVVDPAIELELSPEENEFFRNARDSAAGFFLRWRWVIISTVAAALIYGVYTPVLRGG